MGRKQRALPQAPSEGPAGNGPSKRRCFGLLWQWIWSRKIDPAIGKNGLTSRIGLGLCLLIVCCALLLKLKDPDDVRHLRRHGWNCSIGISAQCAQSEGCKEHVWHIASPFESNAPACFTDRKLDNFFQQSYTECQDYWPGAEKRIFLKFRTMLKRPKLTVRVAMWLP